MYWSIDPNTSELIGKIVLTSARPEDIPGFLITTEPPKKKKGYAIIYNIDQGKWEQVIDNRGVTGFLDGCEYTHKELLPLPDGFTKERPQMSEEEMLNWLRQLRNSFLVMTDWFMLADNFNKLSQEQADDIQDYRQALRDWPETYELKENEHGISWPILIKAPSWYEIDDIPY